MALKVCLLGAVRRRTFICCRNVRISASSAAHDRNRSTTVQTMSLTRSIIPQQHRPIFDQLLVRLSLRYGQADAQPGQAFLRNYHAPARFGRNRTGALDRSWLAAYDSGVPDDR